MIVDEMDYHNALQHYGIKRKSGRYPWGSGGDEATRAGDFFSYIAEMKRQGLTEAQIAEGLSTDDSPYSTTQLRATKTMALAARKAADITKAQNLQAQGYSNVEIGKRFSPPKNESSVRALLAESARDKIDILNATSDMLRRHVEEKGVVDVGKGVHQQLRISKEKLRTAVAMLESEGYGSFNVQIDQLGTQNKTTTNVLAKPGITYKDVVKDKSQIKSIAEISDDGGRSYYGLLPPLNVSSSRVAIVHAEDGGAEKDGLMYIRPGVKDLHMGGKNYAQVRINVDGTHYLKGMAVYKNDLPDGVDIQFHTNKKKADAPGVKDVLKKQSSDPDNPFGAVVDQLGKRDINGHLVELTSALNIVNDEGKWSTWSRNLSSQTLSKQSPALAKQQLDMTFERKKNEFDSIMALTNQTVKQHLLEKFSDSVDASAVHLKAAALPKSSWHVILPVPTLKDNEIFAPNFPDGTQVALIRYPHGGKFEIPELVVNNRHKPAIEIMGKRAEDAVGINAKVAERLSGADFDGDAVLVIPNNNRSIRTMPALQGLKNFDPQTRYKAFDGMKTIDGGTFDSTHPDKVVFPPGKKSNPRGKGMQMGMISNLITDMTIQGANTHEIAAAVRHSMVVIDAEKHHLNYKQSAIDNNITSLKKKYQVRDDGRPGGAATLISRATAEERVRARKDRSQADGGPVDKATGRRMYEPKGESWVDPKTGRTKFPTTKSTRLAETDDAHTLVSKADTKIERVYADHSNKLKAMANESRRVAVNIPAPRVNPSAKKVYAAEVTSLTAKLNEALKNAPRERQAQVMAGAQIKAKLDANPDMDQAHIKRMKSQALAEARVRAGADKKLVEFEGREWEAIQAGAVPGSKLKAILDNTNIEQVKTLATPRTAKAFSNAQASRARQMQANGYTQAEIAEQLGVSVSTLSAGLKESE